MLTSPPVHECFETLKDYFTSRSRDMLGRIISVTGHWLSLYERMWLHSWFAGAAMVTPENSIALFFERAEAAWSLTEHGRKAAEVFRFMRQHERGVPWMPVAVLLDHYAGYIGYMDKPWGILDPTAGDREVRDLFDHQLFPGGDHIHSKPDPDNPESSYLRPTPYGEIFDVLLTSVSPEFLTNYPVILMAGDVEFSEPVMCELERAIRSGSKLLVAERHRQALGERFKELSRSGHLEVLESWTNPATGRPAAIRNSRLEQLARDTLPFELAGDAVQYEINRTPFPFSSGKTARPFSKRTPLATSVLISTAPSIST